MSMSLGMIEGRTKEAKEMIQVAIQNDELDFYIILKATYRLGFTDGPTMWTAKKVSKFLADAPIPMLQSVLDQSTHILRQEVFNENEETKWRIQDRLEELKKEGKDISTLLIKDIYADIPYKWSEVLCIAIAWLSIIWSIQCPKDRDIRTRWADVPDSQK